MVESDFLSIPFITIHNSAETTFPCHFKQSEMISSSGTRHGFVFSFSQLVAGVQLRSFSWEHKIRHGGVFSGYWIENRRHFQLLSIQDI